MSITSGDPESTTSPRQSQVTQNSFGLDNVPYEKRLATLTREQKEAIEEIESRVISSPGQIDEMEAAIGLLRIGHHFGWRALYIVHSKRTIRKYEDILGIKIREFFPERGPSAPRSVGLYLADKMSNFWKVVSGDIKVTNRKDIL